MSAASDATTSPPDADAAAGRAGPRLPAGWKVVARKELADHLNSARFGIILLLLALPAAGVVYAASGVLRDAASQVSGDPAIFLRPLVIALEEIGGTPFALFTFLMLVGPLFGIALGFDAINNEQGERTLPRLVSQPIYRDDVINGKFVAGISLIAVVLTALLLLVAGLELLRLGLVPRPEDVGRLAAFLVLSVVYVGFWLAFAILCSVLFRRPATSALTALGVWLVLTLGATFLVTLLSGLLAPLAADATFDEALHNAQVRQTIGRLFPGFLFIEAAAVILRPEIQTLGISLSLGDPRRIPTQLPLDQSLLLIWPQVVALMALTVVTFAVAYVVFMRREIRA